MTLGLDDFLLSKGHACYIRGQSPSKHIDQMILTNGSCHNSNGWRTVRHQFLYVYFKANTCIVGTNISYISFISSSGILDPSQLQWSLNQAKGCQFESQPWQTKIHVINNLSVLPTQFNNICSNYAPDSP